MLGDVGGELRDRGFPVVRVKDMDLPALVIGMDPRYFPVEDLWFREDMRYFDHVLGPCWAPERCGLVGKVLPVTGDTRRRMKNLAKKRHPWGTLTWAALKGYRRRLRDTLLVDCTVDMVTYRDGWFPVDREFGSRLTTEKLPSTADDWEEWATPLHEDEPGGGRFWSLAVFGRNSEWDISV